MLQIRLVTSDKSGGRYDNQRVVSVNPFLVGPRSASAYRKRVLPRCRFFGPGSWGGFFAPLGAAVKTRRDGKRPVWCRLSL